MRTVLMLLLGAGLAASALAQMPATTGSVTAKAIQVPVSDPGPGVATTADPKNKDANKQKSDAAALDEVGYDPKVKRDPSGKPILLRTDAAASKAAANAAPVPRLLAPAPVAAVPAPRSTGLRSDSATFFPKTDLTVPASAPAIPTPVVAQQPAIQQSAPIAQTPPAAPAAIPQQTAPMRAPAASDVNALYPPDGAVYPPGETN